MKKIILVLALLTTSAAQALYVVCDSTGMSSEMNRFDATGEFTVDSSGAVKGEIFFSGRSILVSGKSTKFAAGEVMKGESQVLDLSSSESSMRLFLKGPLASSIMVMKQGVASYSTCK